MSSFTSQISPIVIPGLIAWYRFREGSGSIVRDESCSNRNADLVNSPNWGANAAFPYVQLNGSNQLVRNTAFLSTQAALTVSLWVNVVDNGGSYRAFFSSTLANTNDYQNGLVMDLGPSSTASVNHIGVEGIGANGNTNLVSTSFAFGVWTHLCLTATTGTNAMRLYINSVAQNARTKTAGDFNMQEIRFGSRFYGGSQSGYLNASIADARIYNRILTSDEIRLLYRIGRI